MEQESKMVKSNFANELGGAAGGTDDDKVEFVKLVEPLLHLIKSDHQELPTLALNALINLCNFSEDIIEIFFMK